MPDITSFLTEHNISVQHFDHAPVFTVEESLKLPPMPGAPTKNLVLRDEKGTRTILVVVGHEKRVDLKALKNLINAKKLSFVSQEKLKECLGVEPGSATLLGLITDQKKEVEVIIDKNIWEADAMQCHPLVNTATLVIAHEDVEKFLKATGHEAKILDVPNRQEVGNE